MDSSISDLSRVLTELGLVVIGLAILARIASRWGFSAIPRYLLAGLAFGKGGLAPLNFSAGFTHIGAEIGVLLLLFMRASLRRLRYVPAGLTCFAPRN